MEKFNFDEVRDQLKEASVIETEEDMGELFGKGPSYVSSAKSKGKSVSLDALTHMAFNIEQEIQEFEDDVRTNTNITPERWNQASILWELQSDLFEQIRGMVGQSRNHP